MIPCTIEIDRNPDGTPKVTRFGEYRFSLILADDTGTQLVIRGFRYNSKVRKVIPPSTPLQRGIYVIADISRELEDYLLQKLSELPEATAFGVPLRMGQRGFDDPTHET